MLIATTESVAGHDTIQTLGEVFGVIVRSRGAVGNFTASIRSIFGGEIPEYTRLIEQARQQALERLGAAAAALGANAVVMMRFDSGEIAANMSEIVAYGTAVVIRPRL